MPQAVPQEPILDENVSLIPPYNLILLDDNQHTFDYVISMLGKIFGYSREKAYKMTKEVNDTGRVIIFTGPLEHCEVYRDKVHAFGKDWSISTCVGSMSAMIEKAE